MIKLTEVYKTFHAETDVDALKNINLHIPAGKIYGIIGQSGAGKSTLIRCINGLEIPDQGKVIVDGIHLGSLSPVQLRQARKKIGMIFQHFNLLSSRTAAGNVAFPLELAGMEKDEIKARVKQMLELVGLTDKASSYPHQLSGGQKQRVGIARALANKPQVLLCDEATSALDPETTKSVLHLLAEINQKMGLTIVIITHEMGVIQEICDYVAVLDNGQIQETGAVIQVFTKAKAEASKRMIAGSINSQIPQELLKRIRKTADHERILLKLSFVGGLAHEPIISSMLHRYDVDANILFGKIDQIKDIPFGMLVLEVSGNPRYVHQALEFMQKQDVEMEVIANV